MRVIDRRSVTGPLGLAQLPTISIMMIRDGLGLSRHERETHGYRPGDRPTRQ